MYLHLPNLKTHPFQVEPLYFLKNFGWLLFLLQKLKLHNRLISSILDGFFYVAYLGFMKASSCRVALIQNLRSEKFSLLFIAVKSCYSLLDQSVVVKLPNPFQWKCFSGESSGGDGDHVTNSMPKLLLISYFTPPFSR